MVFKIEILNMQKKFGIFSKVFNKNGTQYTLGRCVVIALG
jgi:hypothetical protein